MLLQLLKEDHFHLVKKATTGGGEYKGPCPWCGGEDRFWVHPNEGNSGRYHCRQCGMEGDSIQYLMDYRELSFVEAKAMVEAGGYRIGKTLAHPENVRTGTPELPSLEWRTAAASLLDWCVKSLWADNLEARRARAYLHGRGLTDETIRKYQLGAVYRGMEGWWDRDGKGGVFVDRGRFGLPEETRADGKPKGLFLPAGIVIPGFHEGELVRLRVRTDDRWRGDGAKYQNFTGSKQTPAVYGSGPAYLAAESDFCAMLTVQEAGDLVTAVALGFVTGRPDEALSEKLRSAPVVMVALDYDGPLGPGDQESRWWLSTFPNAGRCVFAGGVKDISEMLQVSLEGKIPGIKIIRPWVKLEMRRLTPTASTITASMTAPMPTMESSPVVTSEPANKELAVVSPLPARRGTRSDLAALQEQDQETWTAFRKLLGNPLDWNYGFTAWVTSGDWKYVVCPDDRTGLNMKDGYIIFSHTDMKTLLKELEPSGHQKAYPSIWTKAPAPGHISAPCCHTDGKCSRFDLFRYARTDEMKRVCKDSGAWCCHEFPDGDPSIDDKTEAPMPRESKAPALDSIADDCGKTCFPFGECKRFDLIFHEGNRDLRKVCIDRGAWCCHAFGDKETPVAISSPGIPLALDPQDDEARANIEAKLWSLPHWPGRNYAPRTFSPAPRHIIDRVDDDLSWLLDYLESVPAINLASLPLLQEAYERLEDHAYGMRYNKFMIARIDVVSFYKNPDVMAAAVETATAGAL